MTQALRSVPVVAPRDVYRWQHSSEQSHLSSTKRNRGVMLSHQGWQKLMQSQVLCDEYGCRYTYEQLGERSGLDGRTVSRLLSCDIKIDKQTLRTFFRAFNLVLEAGDYALSNIDVSDTITPEVFSNLVSETQPLETQPPETQSVEVEQLVEQLVEELSQLKQRMREYDRLFHRLGLTEDYVNQQLRA